jgi:hypothetical protein
VPEAVELGLGTGAVQTALDLEEGLAYLGFVASAANHPEHTVSPWR